MNERPLLDTVRLLEDQIVVRYADASDDPEEVIELDDIVRIVVANVPTEGEPWCLHWLLEHRERWTLHFASNFDGASMVVGQLQRRLGFQTPAPEDVAGPGADGTVVWSRAAEG